MVWVWSLALELPQVTGTAMVLPPPPPKKEGEKKLDLAYVYQGQRISNNKRQAWKTLILLLEIPNYNRGSKKTAVTFVLWETELTGWVDIPAHNQPQVFPWYLLGNGKHRWVRTKKAIGWLLLEKQWVHFMAYPLILSQLLGSTWLQRACTTPSCKNSKLQRRSSRRGAVVNESD